MENQLRLNQLLYHPNIHADVDQAKVRELLTPYMLKSIPKIFLQRF